MKCFFTNDLPPPGKDREELMRVIQGMSDDQLEPIAVAENGLIIDVVLPTGSGPTDFNISIQ